MIRQSISSQQQITWLLLFYMSGMFIEKPSCLTWGNNTGFTFYSEFVRLFVCLIWVLPCYAMVCVIFRKYQVEKNCFSFYQARLLQSTVSLPSLVCETLMRIKHRFLWQLNSGPIIWVSEWVNFIKKIGPLLSMNIVQKTNASFIFRLQSN
jgi:hypothetical protein